MVLVDTNTIIEAHRTGTWPALSGGYRIETVEECVTETQTGFQRRRREETIVAKELRASMASVHAVGDRERAELAVRVPDIWLDEGEACLWAHVVSVNCFFRRPKVPIVAVQGGTEQPAAGAALPKVLIWTIRLKKAR